MTNRTSVYNYRITIFKFYSLDHTFRGWKTHKKRLSKKFIWKNGSCNILIRCLKHIGCNKRKSEKYRTVENLLMIKKRQLVFVLFDEYITANGTTV